MSQFHLINGCLLTPQGVQAGDLLLKDGKIQAILSPNQPTPADYTAVACNGAYVSAGFVDVHQHGGGGSDYMDNDPDAYFNATELHLQHGTTSLMPTLTSARKEVLQTSVQNYMAALRDTRIRSNLLGLHIEGPYLSPAQAGAQKPDRIRTFDPEEYKKLTALADGHLKRWSVAPEVEGAKAFADFANQNGITLSIAHSDADYDLVCQAFDWGFRHVTHLYSATSTIVRRGGFRFPGVLESAYLIDDMQVELIADGCHLPHSLLRYTTKLKKRGTVSLITDAMSAAGLDITHGTLGSKDDALPVIIEDGVAKLTDRSAFAGSVATADRLLKNILAAGVLLPEAIKMLTVYPLEAMHLNVKKGQIITGYDADLCVFNNDICLQHVFCRGEMVK